MLKYIISITLLLLTSICLWAQNSDVPYHTSRYALDLGVHQGTPLDSRRNNTSLQENDYVLIEGIVNTEDAPWIRLHFDRVNLGTNSYVVLTSLHDQAQQRLDAQSMRVWGNSSALFTGSVVSISLYIAAGDRNISLSVGELTIGEFIGEDKDLSRSQCGGQDNRVGTSSPRVGRIMPAGCTGWLTPNRAYITAGHCDPLNTNARLVLEFNVPASFSDGTTRPAHPDDQYPIIGNSWRSENAGVGDDWAVFNCGRNPNTGLRPYERQQAFYRMSKDTQSESIRITGYGTDNVPPGAFGGLNAQNQTLQTHNGSSKGEHGSGSDVHWKYRADTERGNSGSPVIATGIISIGVHTHGGCLDGTNGANNGTSFEANDLEAAVQGFMGSRIVYVDSRHPSSHHQGTILRPYARIQTAVNNVNASSGNVNQIGIVGGHYPEQLHIPGSAKGITLIATVGGVSIGPGASARLIEEEDILHEPLPEITEEEEHKLAPEVQGIALQAYPNPFSSTTTIELQLEKPSEVDLFIRNAMGQIVAHLMNKEQKYGGTHKLQFHAEGLPAGLYFSVLTVGEQQYVKKMVLAR